MHCVQVYYEETQRLRLLLAGGASASARDIVRLFFSPRQAHNIRSHNVYKKELIIVGRFVDYDLLCIHNNEFRFAMYAPVVLWVLFTQTARVAQNH